MAEDEERDKGDSAGSARHAENENNSNKPSLEETEAATIIEVPSLTCAPLLIKQDNVRQCQTIFEYEMTNTVKFFLLFLKHFQARFRGYLTRKRLEQVHTNYQYSLHPISHALI